jgi:hypothetical protein
MRNPAPAIASGTPPEAIAGWECRDLAARVLRRLVARYGRDILIIHGNEPGVDSSFAAAAKELGVTTESGVIDRKQTIFLTVGARNRELFLGRADMCIAVHNRISACPRTLNCVRQALQDGRLPTGLRMRTRYLDG